MPTDAQIRQLAGTIAGQADAIDNGTVIGPLSAAVARLAENVDTLRHWVTQSETEAA